MYSTVQYMKACGGRGSAPNPAGELTAPSRVQTHRKTSLHNRLSGVLKCSKTHLQQTRISKILRGQTPGPSLLDPPLNTMNRAANCLTPALVTDVSRTKVIKTVHTRASQQKQFKMYPAHNTVGYIPCQTAYGGTNTERKCRLSCYG